MFISGHFHVLAIRKPHFLVYIVGPLAATTATPTERLQQHPLVFSTNRTFFLWILCLASTLHFGQSTTCCD